MLSYAPLRRIVHRPSSRIRNPFILTRVHHHASDLAFDRGWISAAALQVAETLQAAGFDGYLVGGCVRDLLLHRRPKDFDITTNAGPEQVKQLFRRSRIIGRRFKLVHVRFGRELIEVATYRAKPGRAAAGRAGVRPLSERGRVVDDNVFGSIEQDAARRDFTINALYYDPVRERVMDFLGGVKDARKRTLRMIGDPCERFTEDPVRMLRAIRFHAKLDLTLEERLPPAIADCLELLEDVPAARLYDEVLKMFHHGHALAAWNKLHRYNLASKLFPLTVNTFGGQHGRAAEGLIRRALENTDQRIGQGKPVIPAFLFAVLLWLPFKRELAAQRKSMPLNEAVWAAVEAVFSRQSRRVAVPRRVSGAVGEIWAMQSDLEQRRPKAVPRLLGERRFRAGYDFLLLRQRIGEVDEELARWWTDIQENGPAPAPPPPRVAGRASSSRRKPSRPVGRASSGAA
ncbi:MAG: polynucleotide adenylyltransferase PcnB [Gammaproteobacteria bacterium]|nr:polynucleotide adenylyltransferase PcnB [Gammaproteobacteria bacterium]